MLKSLSVLSVLFFTSVSFSGPARKISPLQAHKLLSTQAFSKSSQQKLSVWGAKYSKKSNKLTLVLQGFVVEDKIRCLVVFQADQNTASFSIQTGSFQGPQSQKQMTMSVEAASKSSQYALGRWDQGQLAVVGSWVVQQTTSSGKVTTAGMRHSQSEENQMVDFYISEKPAFGLARSLTCTLLK